MMIYHQACVPIHIGMARARYGGINTAKVLWQS
jgi:hypothetical protein